jgi:hypothetical protein
MLLGRFENSGGNPPVFLEHVVSTDSMFAFRVAVARVDDNDLIDILVASWSGKEIAW